MLGTESTGKLLRKIVMNLRVLQIAEDFSVSFERRTSLCEACISHLSSCLLQTPVHAYLSSSSSFITMDPYYSHVTTGYGSNHGKYEIRGTSRVLK